MYKQHVMIDAVLAVASLTAGDEKVIERGMLMGAPNRQAVLDRLLWCSQQPREYHAEIMSRVNTGPPPDYDLKDLFWNNGILQ